MKEMTCWEIMNCGDNSCVARENIDKNCWELVEELEDYRAEFKVCSDCLVYVVKTGNHSLTEQEMSIMKAQKNNCVLSSSIQ